MAIEIELIREPPRMAQTLSLIVSGYPDADRPHYLGILSGLVGKPGAASELVVLEARREGTRVGVALAQLLPGRSSLVWPVRAVAEERLASELVERVLHELQERGVTLAQALLESEDPQPLLQCGFEDAGQLLYMLADRETFLPHQSESLDFRTVPPQDPLWRTMIADTYRGSRDFPLVDGWRDLDDILAGYRGTGVFREDLWRIVYQKGEAAGCIVLADFPDDQQGELVYLGLRPEMRGRGWGQAMVRWAFDYSLAMKWRHLVLAVDADNLPARRIYQAAGFSDLTSRRLLVRKLPLS